MKPPFHLAYTIPPLTAATIENGRERTITVRAHEDNIEFTISFGERNQTFIRLEVRHSPLSVRILDLVGNGRSTDKQRRGYGTLLVNLALQVLRRIDGIPSDVFVRGLIAEQRPAVADFWRRFGFAATSHYQGRDGSIEGRLSDLHFGGAGLKAGGVVPVDLSIEKFQLVLGAHSPPITEVLSTKMKRS